MKNIVKFKFEEKEGFLSVVEKENRYYALVQKDTPKVKDIQQTNKLWISYELKKPNYKEINVEVLFDQELVKWVYDKLAADNNLYFKEFDDTLCVLEFSNQSCV